MPLRQNKNRCLYYLIILEKLIVIPSSTQANLWLWFNLFETTTICKYKAENEWLNKQKFMFFFLILNHYFI
jgi:hypothetical protein